jgi:hypothetical protein
MLPGLGLHDREEPARVDGEELPPHDDPISAEQERKRLTEAGSIPPGCWLKGCLRRVETDAASAL